MAEKVALARAAVAEHGLDPVLRALGLARSTWYYQQRREPYAVRHVALREPLEAIAREHSAYGYRRTAAELRSRLKRPVNTKVVRRLHREWDLPLLRETHVPPASGVRQIIIAAGPRANLVAGRDAIEPFEVAYTDFSELVYAGGGKRAQFIVLLDHASKVVPGWAVGPGATTALALAAWKRAKAGLKRLGRSWTGVIVHHDQDPVFTSYGWTGQLLIADRARLSYALAGARDNPEMESFFGRFKVENRSLLLDAADLEELSAVVRDRLRYYNRDRRHSSLGMLSPLDYLGSLPRHAEEE